MDTVWTRLHPQGRWPPWGPNRRKQNDSLLAFFEIPLLCWSQICTILSWTVRYAPWNFFHFFAKITKFSMLLVLLKLHFSRITLENRKFYACWQAPHFDVTHASQSAWNSRFWCTDARTSFLRSSPHKGPQGGNNNTPVSYLYRLICSESSLCGNNKRGHTELAEFSQK